MGDLPTITSGNEPLFHQMMEATSENATKTSVQKGGKDAPPTFFRYFPSSVSFRREVWYTLPRHPTSERRRRPGPGICYEQRSLNSARYGPEMEPTHRSAR